MQPAIGGDGRFHGAINSQALRAGLETPSNGGRSAYEELNYSYVLPPVVQSWRRRSGGPQTHRRNARHRQRLFTCPCRSPVAHYDHQFPHPQIMLGRVSTGWPNGLAAQRTVTPNLQLQGRFFVLVGISGAHLQWTSHQDAMIDRALREDENDAAGIIVEVCLDNPPPGHTLRSDNPGSKGG